MILSEEYQAVLLAADSIDASELLFIQTLKQCEQADRIARDTDHLRAIALAAQLRKDLTALMPLHQAWLSKQSLVKDGVWAEVLQKINLDMWIQNFSK